jgi:hypothetical protein
MMKMNHDYTGLWVTESRDVRQVLLPNGRYLETRTGENLGAEGACQGTYLIAGDHIVYRDDSGLVAEGDFIEGQLHQAGVVMFDPLS